MSAVETLCAFDPAFASAAGKLQARLPPGRASFALERLEVLGTLAPQDPFIALSHRLESFAQVTLGQRLYNPDVLSPLGEQIVTAMFAPFEREEERFGCILSMLADVPIYLAEAITTLGLCDPLALQVAAEVAEPFADLFDAIAQVAQKKASSQTAAGIAQAAVVGRAACKDFVRALKGARVCEPKHILGAEHFAELLKLRALPFDAQEIDALGVERFAKTREKRAEAMRLLTGYADVKGSLRALASDESEEPLRDLRDICRQAREFVGEGDLAPVPSDETVDFIETPEFARAMIPFAAIITPKPLWPVQRSLFYVTRAGSMSDLRNTAVHQAYPGHHLQIAVANTKGELVRNLPWTNAAMGAETTEGWAHYCEAFMHAQGFHGGLADRVQVLNDSVWRAARMFIDVRLQTHKMTRDEAAQLLVDEVGMGKDAALIEVRRYCLTPGYNLSYGLGKHMIRELRVQAEREWGRNYSLSRFHELIMTQGRAPLAWASERIEKKQW